MTRAHLDRVRAYYDATWWDYQAVWQNRDSLAVHFGFYDAEVATHAESLVHTNRFLARLAAIQPGMHVLDAGCGMGGTCIWLARNCNVQCTGITPVASQVAFAERQALKKGIEDRVRFVEGDYCAMPFADASFDVVWACESVCHAEKKADFYREAWRVLRPGGRLVMAEYMRTGRPLSQEAEDLLRAWLHRWAIPDIDTPAEHRAHATEAGFARVCIEDRIAHVRPSLHNLYEQVRRYLWLGHLLQMLGIRRREAHDNHVGSHYLWRALQAGAWSYLTLVADKPA